MARGASFKLAVAAADSADSGPAGGTTAAGPLLQVSPCRQGCTHAAGGRQIHGTHHACKFTSPPPAAVGPGRGSERTLQQFIQSRATGMENDTCGRQVFHNCADVCRKLRLVDSGCRSDTAVFTGSVAVTRPFVSDVTLHVYWGDVGPPNTQCTNKRDSH